MPNGVDSLTAPTAAQATQAAASGVKWWGGYVGGSGLDGQPWPTDAWKAVTKAGITAVPIWAPAQSFTGNPAQEAEQAMAACKRAGVTGVLALDTEHSALGAPGLQHFVNVWNQTLAKAGWTSVVYDGAGYHGTAKAWDPNWDGNPAVGTNGAKQYAGGARVAGIPVDLDSAGKHFLDFSKGAGPGTSHSGGGTKTGSGSGSKNKVVVSPPELTALITLLEDSQHRIISVKRQTETLSGDLELDLGHGSTAVAGSAQADITRANAILEKLIAYYSNGPVTLQYLQSRVFNQETYVRRVRAQTERADHPSVTLTKGQKAALATLAHNGVSKANLAKDRAQMLKLDREKHKKATRSGSGPTGAGGPAPKPAPKPTGKSSASGNATEWINRAIAITGVPASWAKGLAIIAQHESSDNPAAVNNGDSNAAAGHPSEGLMQTIPSTFDEYALAGHRNILNPVDNVIAAIHYIKARYGSIDNVPGVKAVDSGGSYVGY